jgi:flagellar P-ring protein precursor FlgI
MKRITILVIALMIAQIITAQTRLKDISKIGGVDQRQLIGYGLVVGLQGTGDSPASAVTIQSINNMLEHFGLSVPETRIRPNNVAAVMVTATMPPFAASGSQFDVTVSTVGDASSIDGGILLMTPLIDTNNRRFASAQGSISVGGGRDDARNRTRLRVNTGRIPNGAMVEANNPNIFIRDGELKILLHNPDFTTAQRVVTAVNDFLNMRLAVAENASTISVTVPDDVIVNDEIISFIASIENLPVSPQVNARVVINERTGTIVAGGNVQIQTVALAHGNLVLRIGETVEYTTGPFTLVAFETSNIESSEQTSRMFVMESSTVQELASALNAIKMTPRDMISIFQALKEAGALLAELRIV